MNKNRERDFVASSLQAFLDGSGEVWDFDDLMHEKFADDLVRASIRAVDNMPLQYPSKHPSQYCGDEGFTEIEKIIDRLRLKL